MTSPPDQSTRAHLLELDQPAAEVVFAAYGAEAYRARQAFEWVYRKGATGFEQMGNLPKALRSELPAKIDIFRSEVIRRQVGGDGTVKLLLQWPDRATSECVLIPDEPRRTACISSQVGCPAGCRFCASGMFGLQRNLSAGEIVEQVLRISAECAADGQRLSNVVFMGLGEPLANYEAVLHAIRIINAPWGVHIGARKITISTVGLPRPIRKLADEGLQLNLALSLHAPTDELRAELIPWAEKISIAELADACRYYFERTGREITLEYILLHGVNDRPTHALALASFARKLRCNVNLLRYNPVEGLPFERPSSQDAFAFQERLRKLGINAHIRTSRGLDIDAACGQLRRRELEAQAAG